MRLKKTLALLPALALVVLVAGCAGHKDTGEQGQQAEPKVKDVILATTTSTVDSGLLDVLVPDFEQKTGYNLKVIPVGTGRALEMGKKGEADALLVPSRALRQQGPGYVVDVLTADGQIATRAVQRGLSDEQQDQERQHDTGRSRRVETRR